MYKIPLGIVGGTGMVGQRAISLLEHHPWLEVAVIAASEKSAGKTYQEAVGARWGMPHGIPRGIGKKIVQNAADISALEGNCAFVFSAVYMSKDETIRLENAYAAAGIPVLSNNSAHRFTPHVPMLIPEINANHLEIIDAQRAHYGWDKGFIVVKPNCSIQSYVLAIYALEKAGYKVKRVIVTTEQAVSGAGYSSVETAGMSGNIKPLPGEEPKSELEPLKIFGKVVNGVIVPREDLEISALCNRIPVVDGHGASVHLEFAGDVPSIDSIIGIWNDFGSIPQELGLPSAPKQPIVYLPQKDRPQPLLDLGDGMTLAIGRLANSFAGWVKFYGLSHNTVRGAAGGGILNAELLAAKGYFG